MSDQTNKQPVIDSTAVEDSSWQIQTKPKRLGPQQASSGQQEIEEPNSLKGPVGVDSGKKKGTNHTINESYSAYVCLMKSYHSLLYILFIYVFKRRHVLN